MATKKKAAKKAAVLRWNPRWIADPPPPFLRQLDKVAVREITQAKKDFAAQVKAALAKGQR
ncbi:MAG TPA: hypothetical protein VKD91_22895 [Pyrinomonadaceae bacterium]|nr:hypothetical protein [Pyrinomonadaceae bacterium]